MKKLMVIAIVLLVAMTVSVSADTLGIGGAFGLQPVGGLPGSNVMLSAKLPQLPFLLGLGFSVGTGDFELGITADWWAIQQNLVTFVNFYAGPGLYVGVANAFEIGARVPIGINIYPLEILELFVEVAPTITAQFGDPIVFPKFALQGAFGFRFWFDV